MLIIKHAFEGQSSKEQRSNCQKVKSASDSFSTMALYKSIYLLTYLLTYLKVKESQGKFAVAWK